jgi:hypothetical protein
MGGCPNCGAKVGGWFGPKQWNCGTCGRPICFECCPWVGSIGVDVYNEGDEVYFCSEDCAFAYYEKVVGTVPLDKGVVLVDESHVGPEVREAVPEKFRFISVKYTKADFRELFEKDTMHPDARRMYDRVRDDLVKKGVRFTEETEWNV